MVKYLRDELDLLLAAVDQTTGELARAILTEHGLHSMLHSSSFESAVPVAAKTRFCQLYVRKGSKDEARRLLDGAWGKSKVEKLVAKSSSGRSARARGTDHGSDAADE